MLCRGTILAASSPQDKPLVQLCRAGRTSTAAAAPQARVFWAAGSMLLGCWWERGLVLRCIGRELGCDTSCAHVCMLSPQEGSLEGSER